MMRHFAMLLAIPVIAFLMLAPARADDVDRRDPAATAHAFLKAYKIRDVVEMALLANGTNRPMFMALAEEREAHRAYGDIFGGWRWDAVQSASGEVGTVRYNSRGHALVPFNQMGGDVAVIVLTLEDGIWGIEDINSPSAENFEALPTTAPN